jgi:DNA modification methylase
VKGKGPKFKPWQDQSGGEAHNFVEGPICGGNERIGHPAQKPLWLITRLLNRHTEEGSRVLDPFAGVGTTLVAAREMKLYCVGIEKDPEFVKAARARLGG